MVLQSSGSISLSNVKSEFGATFANLGSLYAVAVNVPVSGAISLSHLYGKGASTPSALSFNTSNISTNSSAQSGTVNVNSYVSDTYGAPLTYSVSSYNSSIFTSVTLSTSTMSYSLPLNKFGNTSVSVTVTNRFGKTATISLPFYITGYNIASYGMGSLSLTNNTGSVSLSSAFGDYSGTGLSFSIYSNPYNNAYISGSTLYVPANFRNTSYYVGVTATNSYNQSTSATVYVSESGGGAPTASSMGSTSSLTVGTSSYYFTSYFSGTGLSYSITANPYNNAYISGSYLYIPANYRNTAYNVTITATNSYGSASSTLTVYEAQAARSITPIAGNVLLWSTGTTLLLNSSVDDGSYQINIPFAWNFMGTNYGNLNNGGVYIGTNSYITMGAGSSAYSGLGGNNPPVRTIHIGSADNSAQTIAAKYDSGNNWYYVRFEGTNSTSGTVGSPNIVWEALFLDPRYWFDSGFTLEIRTGSAANSGGLAIVTDGSSQVASYSYQANYRYDFRGYG